MPAMMPFVQFGSRSSSPCNATVGGGTTMRTHCDVVYAGPPERKVAEMSSFRFINLALVPEFGSSLLAARRLIGIAGRRNCSCCRALRCPRGR